LAARRKLYSISGTKMLNNLCYFPAILRAVKKSK